MGLLQHTVTLARHTPYTTARRTPYTSSPLHPCLDRLHPAFAVPLPAPADDPLYTSAQNHCLPTCRVPVCTYHCYFHTSQSCLHLADNTTHIIACTAYTTVLTHTSKFLSTLSANPCPHPTDTLVSTLAHATAHPGLN